MTRERSIFAWDDEWQEGRGDEDMGEAFVETLAEKLITEIEFALSEAEIQRLINGNISMLSDDEYLEALEAKNIRVAQLRGEAASRERVK